MSKNLNILTKSASETKKIGELLAKEIDRSRTSLKTALVISLEGDLGTGKTTFVQGFAKGLGIKENPRSPTFVIMQIYPIIPQRRSFSRVPSSRRRGKGRFSNFIHVDAYRVKSKDLKSLGWRDFMKNPKNIILIEWGNRVKNILPKNFLRIKFKHGKKSNERFVTIKQ